MFDKITVKEAALLWGVTERRITGLCREGKISGAEKIGKTWLIPANTEKPVDKRIKSGAYKKDRIQDKLPLPIGISDYCLASTEYYYVDKTMMIKEFLDERPFVSLFTRPRRFGKTLNMDMLRTFFEKTDRDTSVYFKNKKIWKCGEKYRSYQGKYPVIFVSFKDVKKDTWEETYDCVSQIIALEFKRHEELLGSRKISDKEYYRKVVNGEAGRNDMEISLLMLSKMLHEHYGIAPIIIIDEYDTPIQQGYMRNYYDNIILFMRNLFSGGLKDNKHLSYGFMTGILRVAKESIFSGLNNLAVNTVLDNRYSEYFGFTPDEVKKMAEYYNADDKYNELCEWYNGYRFGNSDIFNPWSVINYFRNGCATGAYWQSTGSNDIIGEVIEEADNEIYEKLAALLQGKSFLTYVDTGVIYPQIKNNPSSIYSFLLVAGYLKMTKSALSFNGDFMCEVSLPNKEISFVYTKEVLNKLDTMITQSTAISIQEAVFSGNAEKLKDLIQTLLLQSVSFYDTKSEVFYHGLMLGLCALLSNSYVTSNRESGEGRYDIQLMPQNNKLPGIIIELKTEKNCNKEDLKKLAEKALAQIDENKYDQEMNMYDIPKIYKYGVAFSGKNVEVVVGDSNTYISRHIRRI
jgi:hypothetical protein